MAKASVFVACVYSSATESQPSKSEGGEGGGEEEPYEEYEVELEKPYGLKFAKGRDGGTYIDAIAPGSSADKTGMFTVGDKVLATRFRWMVPISLFIFHGQLSEVLISFAVEVKF